MKIEDTLSQMINDCPPLFDFLWPVALGEPVGPDGDVFEYGDQQLADLVLEMLEGETQNWPYPVAWHVSRHKKLWDMARTLTIEQVGALGDQGWVDVRTALMTGHPERKIECLYCRTPVPATEDAFHQHYRQARCWAVED